MAREGVDGTNIPLNLAKSKTTRGERWKGSRKIRGRTRERK